MAMNSEGHLLPRHIVKINKLKSLLAIVENSIKGGENYMFRNLYAIEDGKEVDILEDGQNSCAVFVSWILLALELIKKPHATVHGTVIDLLASGWYEIDDVKRGAVIVWDKKRGNNGLLGNKEVDFMHIGFCVSETEAISNASRGSGFPKRHHVTYGEDENGNPVRPIDKILWHPDLD